jgi:ATP-binding cassette, subfamily B (MDR/TAP), member 1
VQTALAVPTAAGLRRARVAGIGQGANQFFMLTMYALNFWAGAQFIKNGWLDFQGLMQSFFAVSMAAIGMGHSSAFAVDAAKADAAKRSLFAIIDRVSAIDPSEGAPGAPLPPGGVVGRLELRDVQFTYPARPEAPVLKGVNLTIEPGAWMARAHAWGSGGWVVLRGRGLWRRVIPCRRHAAPYPRADARLPFASFLNRLQARRWR